MPEENGFEMPEQFVENTESVHSFEEGQPTSPKAKQPAVLTIFPLALGAGAVVMFFFRFGLTPALCLSITGLVLSMFGIKKNLGLLPKIAQIISTGALVAAAVLLLTVLIFGYLTSTPIFASLFR